MSASFAPARAEPDHGQRPPSAFLGALSEAAIHRALEGLDDEARRWVAADVLDFVAGQLEALPWRLRRLFAIGTLGFRAAVVGTTLRTYTALPVARRAAIFNRWAYGRVPLARQLFRVVRSTALLACYEHPAVLARLDPHLAKTATARRTAATHCVETHGPGRGTTVAPRAVDVLVIGSGAGGAVTAQVLAERGFGVLVLEEGPRRSLAEYGQPPPAALRDLYRQRGMTPLFGRVPIGFAEGCCVGGSTEINSGFWHRTPHETLIRWQAAFELDGASPAEMSPHFEWAESALGVACHGREWPPATRLFARGSEVMGWSAEEVPRASARCVGTNACAQGCPVGAKRGMSVSLLPAAEAQGARILPGARALRLHGRRGRITGVLAAVERADGGRELVRIDAEHVVVCGGATQSPLLLRRSGIRLHVGNTLNVHPMLKAAALFDEPVDAHASVLPLLQVKEFRPELSIGGAFFTPGHLALLLSDAWPENHALMERYRHLASFYVAVPGTGRGRVRPALLGGDGAVLAYELTRWELRNLSRGLARMALLLLAAGARAVVPAGHGLPVIRTEIEAARWLDEILPGAALSLTTVHAFSSCPAGERRDRCAVDSYGRVFGFENLWVNDASIVPDSPGVNPQGTIMALARRNALYFAAENRT